MAKEDRMHVHGVEDEDRKRAKQAEAKVDPNAKTMECHRCGVEMEVGGTCPACGWDSKLEDRVIVEVADNAGEAPSPVPEVAKPVGAAADDEDAGDKARRKADEKLARKVEEDQAAQARRADERRHDRGPRVAGPHKLVPGE